MSEFAKTGTVSSASQDSQPLQSVANKAIGAAQDAKRTAIDLASKSAEALQGHADDLVEAAKSMASDAGDRLQEKVAQQKDVGADYIDNLAGAMRRAAGEFDSETPLAGIYVRKAASQIETAAEALRTGNLNDFVQGAQSFARNQPTAFLGLAVLAGFGVVRFLKSASNSQPNETA
jgi:hypothetical protein